MIVYLHGLNSAGTSAKASWLRARLAPQTVHAPTYPAHRADEAVGFLSDYLRNLRAAQPKEPLLLIGSSLGGFYAAWLAPAFGAGMVLINPAVAPHLSLRRHVGPQYNWATGERYVLSDADVAAFARYELARCRPETPTLVLLDAADEVIDVTAVEAFYRGCGRTIVYAGGSHRFEHLPEALPEIERMHATLGAARPD